MSGKQSSSGEAGSPGNKAAQKGWATKMMAKVKKALPFSKNKPGESASPPAASPTAKVGKNERMQNELQEAYNAALREGAVVPASQSWVNQDEQDTRKYASPPTSHSPSKPSRKHTSGEKNHNVTRKKSANTMQKELLALHQEGIKAGYVVAARPPSQPLHADKAAAAQAELQQMYLESLKQGTVGS
jgi:hypothetical protein